MFLVTDDLMEIVESEVARFPPELGGALLGPRGYPVLTTFVLDRDGHTSSVVYIPSEGLTERVAAFEQRQGLELKGVLHSHPGLDRLSGQDVRSFTELLALNPRMPFCAAPVITQGLSANGPHELALPSGKASFYEVSMRRDGSAQVRPFVPAVLPIRALTCALASHFNARSWHVIGPTSTFGTPTVDAALLGTSVGDIFLACPLGYPAVAPIVLVDDGHASRQAELPWALGAQGVERVIGAVERLDGSSSLTERQPQSNLSQFGAWLVESVRWRARGGTPPPRSGVRPDSLDAEEAETLSVGSSRG